jgi:hypothetical protein
MIMRKWLARWFEPDEIPWGPEEKVMVANMVYWSLYTIACSLMLASMIGTMVR